MACWSLVALALVAWVVTTAQARDHSPPWEYCPFVRVPDSPTLSVGETPDLAKLVDELETAELDCIATCVEDMQALADDIKPSVAPALPECDACVRQQAKLQREVARQALDKEQNVGCRLPAKPQDACYVSVENVYEYTISDGGRVVTEKVEGGWWDVPEAARRTEAAPAPKHKKNRFGVPSDGVGSIFSFLFLSFAAALESGCTFVFSAPVQTARGGDVDDTLDFFRAADNCIDDTHASLEAVPSVLASASALDEKRRSKGGRTKMELGRIHYASHDGVIGSANSERTTFKLGILRNAMYICHRRHATVLARLILRAKFELGQDRRRQIRAPAVVPAIVAAAEPKSVTQVAESAWFDPLGTAPNGRMLINVIVHVRRGDVSADATANHGIYALHYTPMTIVTTALETLLAVWTPLADKMGIRFNVHVASEGDRAEFPDQEWAKALDGRGDIQWKLRPKRQPHVPDTAVSGLNVTTLQTMGQMLDADVILADGRSDFSLTAHAWSPSSLLLTYPWLLTMGEPLDGIIDLKEGNATADLPHGHVYGMHPAYEEVLRVASHRHPGTLLLDRVHEAPEYAEELELMYRHRQRAVLEGMLANVVAKKRLALERGAHLNWVVY